MGDIADMYREQECEEEAFDAVRGAWLDSIERRAIAKQRERDHIWTQADGRPIAVKDMTDKHLLAAAALLRRRGFIGPRTLAEAPISAFVDIFDDEIKRRGLPKGGA